MKEKNGKFLEEKYTGENPDFQREQRTLKVFVWKDGNVSLSYDLDDPKTPYFVLGDKNRKKLVKLLKGGQD